MLAQWTADVVGTMHQHRITRIQLAHKLGVVPDYVTMVLNGKRSPAGAEERFKAALEELVKEKDGPAA